MDRKSPLAWPENEPRTPPHRRETKSPFSVTPGRTLDQLDAELERFRAKNVGLPFERCSECKGNGYTKATLLVSPTALAALVEARPKEPVPIQYDRCTRCNGAGGWLT